MTAPTCEQCLNHIKTVSSWSITRRDGTRMRMGMIECKAQMHNVPLRPLLGCKTVGAALDTNAEAV